MSEKFDAEYEAIHGEKPKRYSSEAMSVSPISAEPRFKEVEPLNYDQPNTGQWRQAFVDPQLPVRLHLGLSSVNHAEAIALFNWLAAALGFVAEADSVVVKRSEIERYREALERIVREGPSGPNDWSRNIAGAALKETP